MEALTTTSPSFEHAHVFGCWVPTRDNIEMRLDDVRHVAKDSCGSLFTVIVSNDAEPTSSPHHSLSGLLRGHFRAEFVSAKSYEVYRFKDVNSIDVPSNLWLPVNRLENASRSRGGYDFITHPLSLQLGPGE